MTNRRDLLGAMGLGAAGLALPARLAGQGSAASSSLDPYAAMRWGRGIERQRRADLGDGRYLNPIFAGDHPDPSILRDGQDYYITFSSFDSYPGIVIWHSLDLVNWRPVTAALTRPIGSVWAPELCKHSGRFYCYIPARFPDRRSIYVIHADRIEGPWSDPVDLNLPAHIDPGHAVDSEGRRWLFLSGGDRVPLSPNGLATTGPVEHVYDPWHYPADWVAESFSPEGPKIFRRGDWHYLVTAVGGTAGPPTGHMTIVARARSLAGPWENDPGNPITRTTSAAEKWWSRGHATIFEGPGGKWWAVYHGYENGYWTLGRQTLLEPVDWTANGWPRPAGGDLAKPIRKPLPGPATPHGHPLSDDFSTDRFGTLWSFYDPEPDEKRRVTWSPRTMRVEGKGISPADCSPVSLICGDQRYRFEAELTLEGEAEGGLLLFYNRRLHAGLGFGRDGLVMHRYGLQRRAGTPGTAAGPLRIRVTNDRNIVTIETSPDRGATWTKFGVQMEVSGYHHNVAGDFLSLRPALYAAGKGAVRFADFRYTAL